MTRSPCALFVHGRLAYPLVVRPCLTFPLEVRLRNLVSPLHYVASTTLLHPFMSQSRSSQAKSTARTTDEYITIRIHRNLFSTIRNSVTCALKIARDTCRIYGETDVPFINIDNVFQVLPSQEEEDRLINEALIATFGNIDITPKAKSQRQSARTRQTTPSHECTCQHCPHRVDATGQPSQPRRR